MHMSTHGCKFVKIFSVGIAWEAGVYCYYIAGNYLLVYKDFMLVNGSTDAFRPLSLYQNGIHQSYHHNLIRNTKL